MRIEADGIEVIGLDPDQVNLLAYVAEMLQHGMTPRIVNVHPDNVTEEWEMYHTDTAPLAEGEAWTLAKRADEELENDHHLLDGVSEAIAYALSTMLTERADA